VGAHVRGQGTVFSKTLAALNAREYLRSRVGVHMPVRVVVLCNAITAHCALERLLARDPGYDRTQSLVAVTPDARAVRADLATVGEISMVRLKIKQRVWVLSKKGFKGCRIWALVLAFVVVVAEVCTRQQQESGIVILRTTANTPTNPTNPDQPY
jgi:hypothetical protein